MSTILSFGGPEVLHTALEKAEKIEVNQGSPR